MVETLAEKLGASALKTALLHAVASQDLDQIPPDFDDHARFVVCAVRAVARRTASPHTCVFVYSEAPMAEGKPLGFVRVAHMQDGHGMLAGSAVLTSRDANNGGAILLEDSTILGLMSFLENTGFADRMTVIWDGTVRTATVYPAGIADETNHIRFLAPVADADLTQDDVCAALDLAYKDNLKNPSGRTAKLWSKGKLVSTAEEEIERHLKGQLALFFAGQQRPVRVLSQTNTTAGRTDLMLVQKPPTGKPQLTGVIELKVLRGPAAADQAVATEGLSQGYYYMQDLEVPFATLALYDVNDSPTDDAAPLLGGQNAAHLAAVRVRRFPIYGSPQEWRTAQVSTAA